MKNKLGLFSLTGLVVSAMVGGGVFSLPQNMAKGAGVGAICIAWGITAAGMFFLCDTFRLLSRVKPELTSGIYRYAKEGFGRKAGFFMAWGYWLSNVFAIGAFVAVLMESLNYFFPGKFTGGNSVNAMILASIVIWGFFALISCGVKKAAMINLAGTVCKLVPIVIFIAVVIAYFDFNTLRLTFSESIRGETGGMSMMTQIRNTMILTLWTFIGIEAAVAMSGKTEKQSQVSKAVIFAFFLCISMYVLVSVLPFGILSREAIASYPNPSTAGILEYLVGRWGGVLMNTGLIVSVVFSILSLTTVTAEVPYGAAEDGSFPKMYRKENKNGVPVFSLFITCLAIQLSMFLGFVSENAFQTLLTITAVMIMPVYLVTTMYLFKISSKSLFPSGYGVGRGRMYLTAVMGILYSCWLIYAANLKYLLLALLCFAIGIPVYIRAVRTAK
ncbi:arginine:ornithine antiporter / lysine permease [Parelusimicrobium proximum]|uniref:basic amino acid/polyamine antiporter n=1 Tax=Parelusimicrobium proximum TaxID=3228953 RepID=UPI003D17164C